MRVFIADDEVLIRASLKFMLEELDVQVEIVGEASNGEALIVGIKELKPDMAFVDIKMPKGNGLEGIKAGKSFSPDTQWIILTGFSEFGYAQEAIKLGAANYLLKPVSPEELNTALQDIIQKQQNRLTMQNKEFENDMIALFHGLSIAKHMNIDYMSSDSHFAGSILYIDSHLDEKAKAERIKEVLKELQFTLLNSFTPSARIALFPLPNGELSTMGFWKVENEKAGKLAVDNYITNVINKITDYNDEDFSITLINSGVCVSYEAFNENMSQIEKVSALRCILGNRNSQDLRSLIKYQDNENYLEMSSLFIKLACSYKNKHYLDYIDILDQLDKFKACYPKELVENIHRYLRSSIDFKPAKYEDFTLLLKKLYTHGKNHLTKQQKNDKQLNHVDQVIAYIHEHYNDDIGIAQIADLLGVTPNYLSALFSKKTGSTFMKYLTRIRMLKAQELLLGNDIQVKDVATSVGYYSTRHFTKLFKEFTGIYPSEFAQNFT
jgi:two-component system, response regulator YesN